MVKAKLLIHTDVTEFSILGLHKTVGLHYSDVGATFQLYIDLGSKQARFDEETLKRVYIVYLPILY